MSRVPMNVGMVGVWNFGSYRREQMRQTGLFKIGAAFDKSPQFLDQACRQENARPCRDVDELLDMPGLEGVIICTGADSHADLTIRALRRGLHVFVEKPLCTSVDEIRRLRAVVEETCLAVGVGHAHPDADRPSALVGEYERQDKLGTIAAYEANSSHSGGLEIRAGDWRGIRDRNPGGMLFQCGVHEFHRLIRLFGPVVEVQAMMRYDANPATQTADAANVLLRHASGMVGTLNCYHVTAYCHELRIFGSKGNLYIDTFAHRAFYQQRLRGPIEVREEITVPGAPAEAERANLIAWYGAVRDGTPAVPGFDDGVNALLPVFAAERSAEFGRRVSLDELLAAPEAAGV